MLVLPLSFFFEIVLLSSLVLGAIPLPVTKGREEDMTVFAIYEARDVFDCHFRTLGGGDVVFRKMTLETRTSAICMSSTTDGRRGSKGEKSTEYFHLVFL